MSVTKCCSLIENSCFGHHHCTQGTKSHKLFNQNNRRAILRKSSDFQGNKILILFALKSVKTFA